MELTSDKPLFWNELYHTGETRWDLNTANPVFLDVMNDKKTIKPPCNILIPGSGKGYDAIEAAKLGFEVTALDFSPNAIDISKKTAQKENVKISFICEDIFNLNENYDNYFDAVYDYTMFCVLNPGRREDYAKKISSLLKADGKFIAVLFPVEQREGGPPFSVDPIDVYNIFSKYLRLSLSSKQINSINRRKGREILQIYVK